MSGFGDRVDRDLPDMQKRIAEQAIEQLNILHELLTLPVPDAFARLLALRGQRS